MRIALAQLVSGADPYANLELVADHARRAADQQADLLVCPEATMRCFGLPLKEIAEPTDGPWATRLSQIAAEHDLVIAAGMFTPAGDGRVRNTLRVVGPGVDASYDKIHLFDAFGFAESATVAPGNGPLVVDIAGVGVDLRTQFGADGLRDPLGEGEGLCRDVGIGHRAAPRGAAGRYAGLTATV